MTAFLQCDAEGCDHREAVEAMTAEHIGRRCPKCGTNLLTRADFDASAPLFALYDALNAAGLTIDPEQNADAAVLLSVRHHAGETTIKIKEAK